MAKKMIELNVLVSSPSDLKDERNLFKDIIHDINNELCGFTQIKLNLLIWENYCYSDTSSDPQDVINKQIGSNYDIFVGILWATFGTPTKKAGSGTEEEFNIAYKRFIENPDSVKILFYFKNTPIPVSKINPYEINKIQDFKKLISQKGTLYWEYSDITEFEKLLRLHLIKQVTNYDNKILTKKNTMKNDTTFHTDSSNRNNLVTKFQDNELGFFELIEIQETINIEFEKIMNSMTETINLLGENLQKRTSELNYIKKSKTIQKQKLSQSKKVIDFSADDVNHFANSMTVLIPKFSSCYYKYITTFTSILSIQIEFGSNDKEIELSLNGANEMLRTILFVREKTIDFQDVIKNWPRMSSKIIKSKRNCVEILDSLIYEFTKAEHITEETIKAFH